MPAPSLLQLSTAAAVRNMKYLDDIGNIPYALARPFLLKIESPEKLKTIEQQSPHIMKDDEELWLGFIKRDIPKWEEYGIPEKPESWYEVYCDLREQVQRAVDKDAEKLKMAMEGINSERAKHSAKFVADQRTLRLPQQRPSVKQRYASYDRRMGGIKPVFSAPSSASLASDPLGAPAWSFERPQIPRSGMTESKKKNSIFAAPKRNKALTVPTKQLHSRATQVKAAPRSLIEEHKQPSDAPVAARKAHPTLKVPGRSKPSNPAATTSLQEKEARLRALTSGNHTSSQTSKSPDTSLLSSRAPTWASSVSTSTPKGFPTSSTEPNSQDNSSGDEPRAMSPAQPPRVATIRKRPAPNVFIQPKRKKMT